jgi:hypothetical protein
MDLDVVAAACIPVKCSQAFQLFDRIIDYCAVGAVKDTIISHVEAGPYVQPPELRPQFAYLSFRFLDLIKAFIWRYIGGYAIEVDAQACHVVRDVRQAKHGLSGTFFAGHRQELFIKRDSRKAYPHLACLRNWTLSFLQLAIDASELAAVPENTVHAVRTSPAFPGLISFVAPHALNILCQWLPPSRSAFFGGRVLSIAGQKNAEL